MTLILCKPGKYWNLYSFRATKRQQGEVQPSQQLGHRDVLVRAADLDSRFFFIYPYVKKACGLNMFVLYLMNCVDKNNSVSPTVLGDVGKNNNCGFKGVVPPLFPCLCARFIELFRCSLSGQPLPSYQEWPWHLSHILSAGTLQCICVPQDFYREQKHDKIRCLCLLSLGYMKSLCIKSCTRVNRDQSGSDIVIIMLKYQLVTT